MRVLVTGATDGLGCGLATTLVERGAEVIVHGRDPERVAAVAAELDAPSVCADLSSLAAVRRLARDVAASTDRLDVLVNNAGIGAGPPGGGPREESADGHELRFAVNHLAGFRLTLDLLPLLERSAPARVVFVASIGQAPVDWDDVMIERDYSGGRAYSQSKLAQITCGFELAARLDPAKVTVNSLHPATYMPTKMVLPRSPIDELETGIEATARLVLDPALAGVTGRFFDQLEEATPHAQALDPEARRRLYELSEELTDVQNGV